ncbi:ABC-2 type transport system ATP-binding protein [Friedmanniella endophytica]|uniref:ABC-2 type transport system ATP-binding protein n=1 Tax=Microlunatus kandeliicorticis TaxID=1759536 RepID=A0A7W3IQ13_9ACTN|nr:ABC transporter ATP-binding protein [Microlunatus kandeliicorticis]MBA8793146.1 ABC-2 type transport system ATP-binding protein [Microlunatus kandeliicorticis]
MSSWTPTESRPEPGGQPTQPGPAGTAGPVGPTGPIGAPALGLRGLSKAFGAKQAVEDLDLDVPTGSMFGLVGPNGAGKTTTLSMATGLLRPDRGTATVLGHDVWTDPARAKALMGVLPDGLRLFDRLSGRELLSYVGRLRSVPAADIASRSAELLETLGLADDASELVVDYSAGMTKKIGLACALIHAPRLLILDEPFEAVDPVSGETIRRILRGYVQGGGTVVLSSHVMELVESLCDRVAVVAQGRVLATGTLDEVRAGESLQQRFLGLVGVREGGSEALAWLRSSSV